MASKEELKQIKERHKFIKKQSNSHLDLVAVPQRNKIRIQGDQLRKIFIGLGEGIIQTEGIQLTPTHESSSFNDIPIERNDEQDKTSYMFKYYMDFIQKEGIMFDSIQQQNRIKARNKIAEKLLLEFQTKLNGTQTNINQRQRIFSLIYKLSNDIQVNCFKQYCQNNTITQQYISKINSFLKYLGDPNNTYFRKKVIRGQISCKSIFTLDQRQFIDPQIRRRQRLIEAHFMNQHTVIQSKLITVQQNNNQLQQIQLKNIPSTALSSKASETTNCSKSTLSVNSLKRLIEQIPNRFNSLYTQCLPTDLCSVFQANLNKFKN